MKASTGTSVSPGWEDLASWRDARRWAEQSGWTLVGTGDWAWVYEGADGELAWRITPFDPAFSYFAAVCAKRSNPHLPRIVARRRHPRGGESVLMELLEDVPESTAADWTSTFDTEPDLTTRDMLRILQEAAGECTLPLFMGLDTNHGNVRRRPDGDLVLIDAFWINGIALFEMVVTDPQRAVTLFGLADLQQWAHIPAIDAAGADQVRRALRSL